MIFEIADQYLLETSKAVAYVYDLTAASIIKEIKYWWEQLSKLSPKFRFFPESSKSWLSVKTNGEGRAKKIFGGRGV